VTIGDPFDIQGTVKALRRLLKEKGVKVLVLRRRCEIARMKRDQGRPFAVHVDVGRCKGAGCGICSSRFRCPAISEDPATGMARIREDACCGCGVCADICPFHAIVREANAS
jgi:indolepyruvate ferredoxin oxidoreductase alpha subunit